MPPGAVCAPRTTRTAESMRRKIQDLQKKSINKWIPSMLPCKQTATESHLELQLQKRPQNHFGPWTSYKQVWTRLPNTPMITSRLHLHHRPYQALEAALTLSSRVLLPPLPPTTELPSPLPPTLHLLPYQPPHLHCLHLETKWLANV